MNNNLNLTRTLMTVANCYSSYTEAFEFIIQVWIIFSKLLKYQSVDIYSSCVWILVGIVSKPKLLITISCIE